MADVPISKLVVPGSNDTLHFRDDSAANKVSSSTNGNLAGLDANGNLTDSGVGASSIGNLSGSHLGTCETAAATSAKIVTIGDGTWIPKEGDIIGVKFTYSNTALFVTLNVNGIGNKGIWYGDSVDPSGADYICGKADSYIFYMYDGTYWIWLNEGQHDGNNFPSVAVYTASNQQVKIGTCNYYTLTNKSYCHFIFRYPNTCKDMLFMKINNSSSKTIYINGEISSSTNYTLPAGTYIAYYENDKWYFRTDGILPAKTTEGAEINERLDTTTTSASGNPISITGLKSNQLAVNPVITFEPIQAGSGDPSPSNVRAISGYDKIEVLSCGKNICDVSKAKSIDVISGTMRNGLIIFLHSGYYTISRTTGDNLYYGIKNRNEDSFVTTGSVALNSNVVINVSDNQLLYLWVDNNSYISRINNLQVEEGQTATTYEPCNKTTDLSEPLPQTVYWGELDVRTGKFSNLGKKYTFGSYTGGVQIALELSTRKLYTIDFSDAIIVDNSNTQKLAVSDKLKSMSTYDLLNNSEDYTIGVISNHRIAIWLPVSVAADGVACRTWLNDNAIDICYQIASPPTIQLTPHEISLLKDYAYVSTNGTSIALDYHNGEIATLGDVSQLGETVNWLSESTQLEVINIPYSAFSWNASVSGFTVTISLDRDRLLGFIVMATNGGAIMNAYYQTNSLQVVGFVPKIRASIDNTYQFVCYAILKRTP